MRRHLLSLPAVLALIACPGPAARPDGGTSIDTSCGLDCDAQAAYGLITNRCFEYSAGNAKAEPPDLGVAVEGVAALEGESETQAIRVVYFRNGQRLMEDLFILPNGDLRLARRVDPESSRSVTYRDANQAVIGVPWVEADTAAGQSFSETVTANVRAGATTDEETQWRGNVFAATTSEKTTPAGAYEDAVAIGYTETPDHALDPRRVFVRNTGFVQINTRLSLELTDAATPYKLQGTRELTAETLSNCGSAN